MIPMSSGIGAKNQINKVIVNEVALMAKLRITTVTHPSFISSHSVIHS
jgi:hypothetical protein